MRLLPTLLTIVCVALPAGSPAADEHARYRIHLEGPEATSIDVEAEFTLAGDTIGMYILESPELANGSADLVESIEATDVEGQPLRLTDLGIGDWRVEGGQEGDRIRLRYSVRLEHGAHRWSPGIDEVAYRTDDGLFFAGRAIFVIPFDGLGGGVALSFDLPEGWKLSHPWDTADGSIRTDATGLTSNCFFVGTHLEEEVRLDEFTFLVAMGRDLADRKGLFVETMRPVLGRARAIFGGMPARDRYLVVVNRHDRSDGGAYDASYSLLVQGPVDAASSVIWGHGVVHEVLHFWNGHTLRRAGSREEWFNEGITDYLTVLLRARTGQEPREITYRKIENAYRRVLLSRMMMGNQEPLDVAGENKQRNRMLVYGGGLLVGFALDVRIRAASDDESSLFDLLAALYEDFAGTDRRYTVEDIEAVASRLAGEDLTPFFDAHVRGPGLPDFSSVLRPIGLRLDTMIDEVYVSELEDATGAQRSRREALFSEGS